MEAAVEGLRDGYRHIAVGYADCGSYGALDEVCARLGVARLAGSHCYDVFAGADTVSTITTDEPGSYFLTDYLVLSFHRSVIRELGLDRYPELRDDYFGNYRRVVWLAQRPTPELRAAAQDAATVMGLPLEISVVGDTGLEHQLRALLAAPRTD